MHSSSCRKALSEMCRSSNHSFLHTHKQSCCYWHLVESPFQHIVHVRRFMLLQYPEAGPIRRQAVGSWCRLPFEHSQQCILVPSSQVHVANEEESQYTTCAVVRLKVVLCKPFALWNLQSALGAYHVLLVGARGQVQLKAPACHAVKRFILPAPASKHKMLHCRC